MLLHQSAARIKQQGAALIAVLIILLVITVMGVTAMRMGLTGLALATNSQVGYLLFQAADKGLTDLEKAVNLNTGAAIRIGGIVGSPTNTYCVTPTTATEVVSGLTAGACNAESDNSFLSARKISMVQVNYTKGAFADFDSNSTTVSMTTLGGGGKLSPDKMTVTSTSVMIGMSSASTTTLNGCFVLPGDDSKDASIVTITDCLTDSGAIFTTHQNDYSLGFNL